MLGGMLKERSLKRPFKNEEVEKLLLHFICTPFGISSVGMKTGLRKSVETYARVSGSIQVLPPIAINTLFWNFY